jgi:hypothetical protein
LHAAQLAQDNVRDIDRSTPSRTVGGSTRVDQEIAMASRRRAKQVDPYQPPSREAQEASELADDTEVPGEVVEALQQTRPWVLVLGGVGVTGAVLFGLGAFVLSTTKEPGGSALFSAACAIACLVPSMMLWRFGQGVQRLGVLRTNGSLVEVLRLQKSFWRVATILTLTVLVLMGGVTLWVMASGPWD